MIPGKKKTNEVNHRTPLTSLETSSRLQPRKEILSKAQHFLQVKETKQSLGVGAGMCEAECQGGGNSGDTVPQKCTWGSLQFVLKSPVTDVDDQLL